MVELLAAARDPSALPLLLWEAAKEGDVAAVEALLAEGKVQIDYQDLVMLCCVWLWLSSCCCGSMVALQPHFNC